MTPLLPAFTAAPEKNQVYNLDLFELCAPMPSASVDMILCDLPYGTTACAWDTVIPFAPMWLEFSRIIKSRGAIVLTASGLFAHKLAMSNENMFQYDWVWDKKYQSNPFLAETQPLRKTETVLVFSHGGENYYPQMIARPDVWMRERPSYAGKNGDIFGKPGKVHPNASVNEWMYPTNLIEFPLENPSTRKALHPTQKPVELFRYLIRTYTEVGQTVFDPCVGSGTTAVAAREEGRSFIVGDSSLEYVEIARARLAAPYTPSFMPQLDLTA